MPVTHRSRAFDSHFWLSFSVQFTRFLCHIQLARSNRSRLTRRRTVRPVYACSACKDQSPVQAPMPPQVIDKGICGPGLLAHVVLVKYLEHRPLYRLQQELARFGVEITRTTLADWVAATATALEPLYRLVRDDLMAGSYLQVDETPVQVMDPEVEGRTATGWLWVCQRAVKTSQGWANENQPL